MIAAVKQIIQSACAETTDSLARVLLFETPSRRQVDAVHGQVSGPYSSWAKTLPTTFALRPFVKSSQDARVAEASITDPCYWSPDLPLLYRIDAEIEFANGTRHTVRLPLALVRWRADGPHLRRESKRVVLRGAAFDEPVSEDEREQSWKLARDSGTTLLVKSPSFDLCRDASRLGFSIVADLRERTADDIAGILREYSWQPSVVAVFVGLGAPSELPRIIIPRVAAWAATADNQMAPMYVPPWINAWACELGLGQQPPTWLASCGKPVIAIRRGVAYADFHEARAACDRLQADLAPEFDLAGYFVGP